MILLGCNIYSILVDRLETSFKFIEQNVLSNEYSKQNNYKNISSNLFCEKQTCSNGSKDFNKITWFLSGGIKNDQLSTKSEASEMKFQIDNNISLRYNDQWTEWDYVLDERSRNTAENFVWVSQFLNSTEQIFDSVYVVTSEFHHKRAKLMLELIDNSRNYEWILGTKEEIDSRYWESIHIQNVHSDVLEAKEKIKLN